ncbi:MAG: hypothetical protein OXI73_11400 [Rhodospirillales bacterium]|nr:hypothetical protein [Rhodospirillales bacterium]
MNSDTKINVSAVIGMGALLLSVMVLQGASTNARIDDIGAHVERLDMRIDDLRSDMREDHAAIRMRLDATNARINATNARIDTLQEILFQIAQRLSHVEVRLGMLRGVDGEDAP